MTREKIGAPPEAPSGALESSPGRKPCGTRTKTRQPRRGVRKRFVPGNRSLDVKQFFRPLRGSLLCALLPMACAMGYFLAPLRGWWRQKSWSKMYKLQWQAKAPIPGVSAFSICACAAHVGRAIWPAMTPSGVISRATARPARTTPVPDRSFSRPRPTSRCGSCGSGRSAPVPAWSRGRPSTWLAAWR